MQKISKLVIYATTTFIIGTGVNLKVQDNKSKDFEKAVYNYAESFESDNYLIAAHRGYSSLEIENTKEAIELASNCDYIDYIEFDARLTKDGVLVISHNDKIDDNTYVSKSYYNDLISKDYTYNTDSKNSISEFFNKNKDKYIINRNGRLNEKKYNVISLSEALSYCGNKKVLLDLKFNNDKEMFLNSLTTDLKNIDPNKIIIQSSDIESLKYIRNNLNNYNFLAIIENKSQFKYIDEFDNIGIEKSLINEQVINKLNKNNGLVAVWTINSIDDYNQVINNLGSNYSNILYITDYPDLGLYLINNKDKIKKLVN